MARPSSPSRRRLSRQQPWLRNISRAWKLAGTKALIVSTITFRRCDREPTLEARPGLSRRFCGFDRKTSRALFEFGESETRLVAEQGPGQAGRPSTSIDREFAAGKRSYVESRRTQAFVGPEVLFNRQQSPATQREHVTSKRLAFGIVDIDQLKCPLFEQFYRLHGEPGPIDECGLLIEDADQRHQMQALRATGAMRQRSGDDIDALCAHKLPHLGNTGGVCAISTTN